MHTQTCLLLFCICCSRNCSAHTKMNFPRGTYIFLKKNKYLFFRMWVVLIDLVIKAAMISKECHPFYMVNPWCRYNFDLHISMMPSTYKPAWVRSMGNTTLSVKLNLIVILMFAALKRNSHFPGWRIWLFFHLWKTIMCFSDPAKARVIACIYLHEHVHWNLLPNHIVFIEKVANQLGCTCIKWQ